MRLIKVGSTRVIPKISSMGKIVQGSTGKYRVKFGKDSKEHTNAVKGMTYSIHRIANDLNINASPKGYEGVWPLTTSLEDTETLLKAVDDTQNGLELSDAISKYKKKESKLGAYGTLYKKKEEEVPLLQDSIINVVSGRRRKLSIPDYGLNE